jgi:hypothetical protein
MNTGIAQPGNIIANYINKIPKFMTVKKLIFLILVFILVISCNKPLCPAYSDSANNVKNSLFQSGAYRANGINRFYRDSYRKK